jgi:hypothetical protein
MSAALVGRLVVPVGVSKLRSIEKSPAADGLAVV